jgi:transglutaminase-like putative cysteine protease
MAGRRRLIGAAVLALAVARLARLLQPQETGAAWQVVLLAAALLGAAVAWWGSAARLPAAATALAHVAGTALMVVRLAAPATLRFGVVPGAETLPELSLQLGFAVELIRYGAAPVLPMPGLVAVLGVVAWLLGATVALGGPARRRWLAALPSLAFYFQLAVLDRRPPGMGWTVAGALASGLALLTVAPGADPASGRVRDAAGRFVPRVSGGLTGALLVLAVAGAIGATSAFAATVPESGLLSWRNRSGFGSGLYGGGSFNLFVGLQQDLVSLSDDPVFFARVSDPSPPPRELYWRLLTLDSFDGQYWTPGDRAFSRGGRAWEREEWRFRGPTLEVAARVRVAGLREQLLPTLYSLRAITSPVDLIDQGYRIREDGSIVLDLRSREGWEYEILAEVPQPDVAALASVGGELSPIFAEAAVAGVYTGLPVPTPFEPRPDSIAEFLELPDGFPREVQALAAEIAEPGATRFEQALLLEAWFRDPGTFTYSTDVSTGHSSLDLADWLLDPESRNYRTGYCEQFATAMAAMARAVGIPARVALGFTPGEVQQQADGSRVIVVRERNAHAWVELWFDVQGWVRFDPTPRGDGANPSLSSADVGFDPRNYLPAPEDAAGGTGTASGGRPDELGPDLDLAGSEFPVAPVGGAGRVPAWLVWLAVAAGLASIVPGLKLARRKRRIGRIQDGDVTAAWAEVVDRLHDLGVRPEPTLTPLEAARRQHPDLVPLASLYSAAVYGGRTGGDVASAFAAAERRITMHYERLDRALAWMNPASLRAC